MITLKQISVIIGLTLGVSVFILFVIALMPGILLNNEMEWDKYYKDKNYHETRQLDPSSIKEKIESVESYKLFMERYPNAHKEFYYDGFDFASYTLGVANFTSKNILELKLDYEPFSFIDQNISCDKFSRHGGDHFTGVLVNHYIVENQCLEKGPIDFHSYPLIPGKYTDGNITLD